MSDEKKPARPGSARAKLEAFERTQKGRKSFVVKIGIIFALLVVVLLIQFLLVRVSDSREWFDVPKNASWLVRNGDWDALRKLLSDQLTIEGHEGLDADGLLALLRGYGEDGLDGFATHPHSFGKTDGGRWVTFWAVWSRGDLQRSDTVPLVRTWLVHAEMAEEDGVWVVRKLHLRRAVGD